MFAQADKGSCPGLPNQNHTAKREETLPFTPNFEFDETKYPTKCDHCDFLFNPENSRSVGKMRVMIEVAGLTLLPEEAPTGTIWETGNEPTGKDGRSLAVKTEKGIWYIDAKTSSIEKWERTGKEDDLCVLGPTFKGHTITNGHLCWTREEPRAPIGHEPED